MTLWYYILEPLYFEALGLFRRTPLYSPPQVNRRYWGPLLTCLVLLGDMFCLLWLRWYQRTFLNDLNAALCVMVLPAAAAATYAAVFDDRNNDVPMWCMYADTMAAAGVSFPLLLYRALKCSAQGGLLPADHKLGDVVSQLRAKLKKLGPAPSPSALVNILVAGSYTAGRDVVFNLLRNLDHSFERVDATAADDNDNNRVLRPC